MDKLSEIEINIDDDLLTVMMLYSLPSSYENFHCAIKSKDELSKPEALRIKIIEESNSRLNDRQLNEPGAFNASHLQWKSSWKNKSKKNNERNEFFNQKYKDISKIISWKCKNSGHYASQCESNKKYNSNHKKNNLGLLASTKTVHMHFLCQVKLSKKCDALTLAVLSIYAVTVGSL